MMNFTASDMFNMAPKGVKLPAIQPSKHQVSLYQASLNNMPNRPVRGSDYYNKMKEKYT
jgi:hypothetical protein